LQYIYEFVNAESKGKLISLATETDRTLFFDFLPIDFGTIRGFKTRFHLYTVPGQVFYDASRKLILRGVDGIVFVADSQEERMDANMESIYNLTENLKERGYDLAKIPYVLQLNKRDLPGISPVDEMKNALMVKGEPLFEAVAVKGVGVLETLESIAKQVLYELRRGAKE
jgi:signal recognition particle receptor subunit beta